ncbi:MAG: beta-ketoacyl synthase chain length factor [Proteobacteria bacterium]|nr:beta-ketoacyl synthase chain length factor [Pseudomonadota bacterium]
MIRAAIGGVGVWGPGLAGWPAARAVLAGTAPWQPDEGLPPAPALLAPAERRRAGAATRLALAVAAEACAGAGVAAGSLPGVFATSNGDGVVVGALLETLASDAPQVSPTQFHNSVHNAAAGYWTIATASRAPVTCLSGHDGSFAAGLLRATAEVCSTGGPVLLVVYDLPVPPPMMALRGTRFAFATALVLVPAAAVAPGAGEMEGPGTKGAGTEGAGVARLAGFGLDFVAAPVEAGRELPRRSELHDLAGANPAARSLRLLEALAAGRAERISLALFDGQVDVALDPCSTAAASAH